LVAPAAGRLVVCSHVNDVIEPGSVIGEIHAITAGLTAGSLVLRAACLGRRFTTLHRAGACAQLIGNDHPKGGDAHQDRRDPTQHDQRPRR
jgi:hypothetical protein